MNKIFASFSLVTLLFLGGSVFSCDICGCAAGGNIISNLPTYQVDFAGVKYSHLSFIDPIEDFSNNNGEAISKDVSHRADLWFRKNLNKRWQLYAIFPLQLHERHYVDGDMDQINGLGDINTIFNYRLITTTDSSESKWKHNLVAGAGVKLPTGKYRKRNRQRTLFPQNFQIGTGAFTFSPDVIYNVNTENFGFNADFFYRFNLENESSYKVGNQISSGVYMYYWYKGVGYSLMPRLGGYFEWFGKDKEYSFVLQYSGGNLLYGTMGLDWYVGNFRLSGSYLVPAYYYFPSTTVPLTKFSVDIIYIFNHEKD